MKAQSRPKQLHGITDRVETGCGKMYITITDLDGKILEVFTSHGKAGNCASCQTNALAKVISIGLRAGVDVEEYIKTLSDMKCGQPTIDEGTPITSCPDAIANAIKKRLEVLQNGQSRQIELDTGTTEYYGKSGERVESIEQPDTWGNSSD